MSITDRAHLPAGLEPGKAGPIPATTGSVSVFDDRTCNATTTSGCGDVRTLQLPGGNGLAVTVDPATDTVYVTTAPASGPDTVSVFNGATCNATQSGGETRADPPCLYPDQPVHQPPSQRRSSCSGRPRAQGIARPQPTQRDLASSEPMHQRFGGTDLARCV